MVGYLGYTVTVGLNTYNSTGIYIDTIPSVSGCDSIVTTNLTIYPVLIYSPCGPVSYTIPAGVFDPINLTTATFTVTLSNGDPLPAWLVFDPLTQTFSGTAPCVDTLLNIIVTCTGSSKLVVVYQFTLQIGNITSTPSIELSNISVYPNPTTGSININSFGNVIDQVKVYDITGNLLINKVNLNSFESIDVSEFSKGIYTLQIITNNKISFVKIVKQ